LLQASSSNNIMYSPQPTNKYNENRHSYTQMHSSKHTQKDGIYRMDQKIGLF